MALPTEIWISDIQENLFEGSEFINMSMNHDSFVSNNVVHLPQAGARPAVAVDRSVFPATITQRTDADLTYILREFSTDPIHVQYSEDLIVSYDKRRSIIYNNIQTLNERMGDEVANIWANTNPDFVTSGPAGTLNNPAGDAARLTLTKEDVKKLALKLDKDNVPKSGRYLLLTHSMYYELFLQDELLRKDYMNKAALPAGVIDQLFGFNIMARETVVYYNGSTTGAAKKAVGSAIVSTDSYGAIAWQQGAVSKALGGVEVFQNQGVAEYYGDIMSALIRLGAAKMRADGKGIATLVQGV